MKYTGYTILCTIKSPHLNLPRFISYTSAMMKKLGKKKGLLQCYFHYRKEKWFYKTKK